MDVSIIIINYNTYRLTCECVRSVLNYTSGLDYEVIVIDNGSTEIFNETDFSAEFPSNVRLIVSAKNLGFAAGNNLGIAAASGKYLLLLNSDTLLKSNAVKTSLEYLQQHPKAGVVSLRLVYPDGRHQSAAQRFPSVKYKLIELFRLQKLLPKRVAGRLLLGSFFDHSESLKVDWVWGTWFMFPAAILKQLPGNKLDDAFFMYFEDMQWCKDISKLGYEIHFCADAEIIHLMGGSSGPKSELMVRNQELFLKRNYTSFQIYWFKKLDRWVLM